MDKSLYKSFKNLRFLLMLKINLRNPRDNKNTNKNHY